MSAATVLIDDFRLRKACESVAAGFDEMKSLGLSRELIEEAVMLELNRTFSEEGDPNETFISG